MLVMQHLKKRTKKKRSEPAPKRQLSWEERALAVNEFRWYPGVGPTRSGMDVYESNLGPEDIIGATREVTEKMSLYRRR
jgi:hypothetical protein